MTDPRVLALVRALQPGQTVWLPAAGKSLWPLVWPGDVLLVERCGPEGLRPGDIALVESPTSLVAHIVAAVSPLATVSAVGIADPPGLPALGRVIALKRGSRRVDLPRLVRPLIRLAPRVAVVLKRVPFFRRLVQRLRDD